MVLLLAYALIMFIVWTGITIIMVHTKPDGIKTDAEDYFLISLLGYMLSVIWPLSLPLVIVAAIAYYYDNR